MKTHANQRPTLKDRFAQTQQSFAAYQRILDDDNATQEMRDAGFTLWNSALVEYEKEALRVFGKAAE